MKTQIGKLVYISASVRYIGERAFETPGTLVNVRCDANKPPKMSITREAWNDYVTPFSFLDISHGYYVFDYNSHGQIKTTLYVPKGTSYLYKAAKGWNRFDVIVEQ